jgi:hypothetical protein
MIIFGNRLFGKIDQVPGLGYVATRFFHIDYLPLIPYEGWLVFHQQGKTWRGVKIPLSFKSLLVAWGRTASVVAGVGAAIAALVMISNGRSTTSEIGQMVVLALAGWGLFAFTMMHKSVTRASYKRALELARHAKLNPKGMAALAAAYGEAAQVRGFEPVQTKRMAAAMQTIDDSDAQIPVEEIPVELEADDMVEEDQPIQVVSESPKPRAEVRRHG